MRTTPQIFIKPTPNKDFLGEWICFVDKNISVPHFNMVHSIKSMNVSTQNHLG